VVSLLVWDFLLYGLLFKKRELIRPLFSLIVRVSSRLVREVRDLSARDIGKNARLV